MKIAKFFSGIFAALGTAVLAVGLGWTLLSLNAEPRLVEVPRGARETSQALADALTAGDLASAGRTLYGQPELGAEVKIQTLAGQKVWQAYLESLSCTLKGDYYALDSGLARDAAVTALDVAGVTDAIVDGTHTLMTQRMDAATDMDELYDATGSFRQELVEEVVLEAVDQALAQAETRQYDVTLNLVKRDDQWWVVPDQALLQAIGGTGR